MNAKVAITKEVYKNSFWVATETIYGLDRFRAYISAGKCSERSEMIKSLKYLYAREIIDS